MSLSRLKRRVQLAEKRRAATGADGSLAALHEENDHAYREAMRRLRGPCDDTTKAELEALLSCRSTSVQECNDNYMRVMRLLAPTAGARDEPRRR